MICGGSDVIWQLAVFLMAFVWLCIGVEYCDLAVTSNDHP